MRNIHFDFRYETLRQVIRSGSYTAAGKELSLTASAVSQQIHSLENELNVRLFTNNGGKILPTPDCENIYRYLVRIDDLCEQMREDLEGGAADGKHITVGLTPSAEDGSLSRTLSEMQDRIDGIHITVRIDSAARVGEMLRGGIIDFAIVDGNFEDTNLNSVILDTDRLGAVVPSDSEYAAKKVFTLEDLKRERLILRPAGSGTRTLFEANLRKLGISEEMLHIMMEVGSVATIKKLVSEKFGVSILSERVCEKESRGGQLLFLPVAELDMVRDIRLFYRKDYAADEILHLIRSAYSESVSENI